MGSNPTGPSNLMTYLFIILIAFGRYAAGRIGHILGGQLDKRGVHLKAPHHWAYGILAIILGIVFYRQSWAKWLIAFGIGHTISDLSDMLKDRVFDSSSEPEVKKFWGID